MDLNNQEPIREAVEYKTSSIEISNSLFSKSFAWMFLGLLATAIVSIISVMSGLTIKMAEGGNSFLIVLLIEFAVVLLFSFGFKKFSATAVTVLYCSYAILNGITFSIIFYIFELKSIVSILFITAGIFGGLSLIGKNTERDLTSFGSILSMFLIGGLIASLINLFLQNSILDIIIDWVILLFFLGVTVYDVHRLKNASLFEDTQGFGEKLHIYFAMQLYLDFINIFIRILSIFGKRRN